MGVLLMIVARVAPRGGAWIETISYGNMELVLNASRPAGARGSKLNALDL